MAKKKTGKIERASVYIMGEAPMVEEFAEVCANHGYSVLVSWNVSPKTAPSLPPSIRKSQTIPKNSAIGIELTNSDLAIKKKNLAKLDAALEPERAILSSSVAVTATEQSNWIIGKHRLVGISALPTLIEKPLVELAPTVFSPRETVDVVANFFMSLKKEIEIVQDRVGMVLPRILCQLINESAFALTEEVATPQDVDTAMKLGANYPIGPVEWADKIGLKQVYAVLEALYRDLKEERYRISPLLSQMVQSGEYWKKN